MNPEALICEHEDCKLILENPVALSCGYTLCQKHLENYSGQFKCFFCNEEHQIPKTGFAVNRSISKMVDAYFEMDPLKIKIKESFSILIESIHNYQSINPDVYVYDYFAKI